MHDLLLFEPAEEFSLQGGFADDLVLRASQALEAAAGRRLPASFQLHKRIPPGSGLGGGSSDAAAALRALARLYRLQLDLAPVAAGVGADVAFFLHGGTALARGRGERLTPQANDSGWYAIAWPGYPVATAEVFRQWDAAGGDGINELTRAAFAVEPRLAQFAAGLGTGWQMTGSGSAFFRRCRSRAEAEAEAASRDGWTAAARAVLPWQPLP